MTPRVLGDRLGDVLDGLDTVGLDELVATAELQTRKDRKYLVPAAALPDLIAEISIEARVLTIGDTNRFRYRSTYFDTPDLDSYLDAARRRPSRFKVRTRRYLDSGSCMLEVKTRDRRGRTVKHRESCDPAEENGLTVGGQAFVAAIEQIQTLAGELEPTLTTSYRRTTLLLDSRSAARITIDTSLSWHTETAQLDLGPFALIETKSSGKPCPFDHVLWQSGQRPTTISKYCTGLAAIQPHLPANKWNRVLRQHLHRQSGRTFPEVGARAIGQSRFESPCSG